MFKRVSAFDDMDLEEVIRDAGRGLDSSLEFRPRISVGQGAQDLISRVRKGRLTM